MPCTERKIESINAVGRDKKASSFFEGYFFLDENYDTYCFYSVGRASEANEMMLYAKKMSPEFVNEKMQRSIETRKATVSFIIGDDRYFVHYGRYSNAVDRDKFGVNGEIFINFGNEDAIRTQHSDQDEIFGTIVIHRRYETFCSYYSHNGEVYLTRDKEKIYETTQKVSSWMTFLQKQHLLPDYIIALDDNRGIIFYLNGNYTVKEIDKALMLEDEPQKNLKQITDYETGEKVIIKALLCSRCHDRNVTFFRRFFLLDKYLNAKRLDIELDSKQFTVKRIKARVPPHYVGSPYEPFDLVINSISARMKNKIKPVKVIANSASLYYSLENSFGNHDSPEAKFHKIILHYGHIDFDKIKNVDDTFHTFFRYNYPDYLYQHIYQKSGNSYKLTSINLNDTTERKFVQGSVKLQEAKEIVPYYIIPFSESHGFTIYRNGTYSVDSIDNAVNLNKNPILKARPVEVMVDSIYCDPPLT